MLWLVTILMLPVVLPAAVIAADRAVIGETLPVVQSAPTLEWAHRQFTSKQEFATFLRTRGASYKVWERRHPGAAPWRPGARGRDVYAAWGLGTSLMFLLLFSFGRPRLAAAATPSMRRRRGSFPLLPLTPLLGAIAAVAVTTGLAFVLLASNR